MRKVMGISGIIVMVRASRYKYTGGVVWVGSGSLDTAARYRRGNDGGLRCRVPVVHYSRASSCLFAHLVTWSKITVRRLECPVCYTLSSSAFMVKLTRLMVVVALYICRAPGVRCVLLFL